MKNGEIKFFLKDGKYVLTLWNDKNEVAMLITRYDNSTQTINRKKKRGENEEVTKPVVVLKYNESIGGIFPVTGSPENPSNGGERCFSDCWKSQWLMHSSFFE